MADKRLSCICFKRNVNIWKVHGLWLGGSPSKFYILYSVCYLFFFVIIHVIFLTLNLIYVPRTIDLFIPEMIFYFTAISVVAKVAMIIFKRKEICEAFDILDCKSFEGYDDVSKIEINENIKKYVKCLNFYTILCHACYLFLIVIPLLSMLALGADRVLPIAKYYFMSDEIRDYYFMYWFTYQSICTYVHMSYNIANDTFISGLLWMAVTQLRVINHELCNMKLKISEQKLNTNIQEQIMYNKLVQCLKHYELYLEFCSKVQDIIDIAIFISFGVAASIICVGLCLLTLLPSTIESILFMAFYQMAMIGEVFVPAWFGTQITYENLKLVSAAYNSDWISRSEKFKRSLRLFVERANKPIVLKGYKIFPLALSTFIGIMKFSYSSFTLVRKKHLQQIEM